MKFSTEGLGAPFELEPDVQTERGYRAPSTGQVQPCSLRAVIDGGVHGHAGHHPPARLAPGAAQAAHRMPAVPRGAAASLQVFCRQREAVELALHRVDQAVSELSLQLHTQLGELELGLEKEAFEALNAQFEFRA